MIDHRIIDPRTPCRILYNSINSVTSKTNRRRSNNSLLPPLFETPIDSKNFFPLFLPRLKEFFDCVHACTHTTKRIISRWRIMIGRYNGINSLNLISYGREWISSLNKSQLCRLTKGVRGREREKERELIHSRWLRTNEQNESLTFIQFLIYIYMYLSFDPRDEGGEDFH